MPDLILDVSAALQSRLEGRRFPDVGLRTDIEGSASNSGRICPAAGTMHLITLITD